MQDSDCPGFLGTAKLRWGIENRQDGPRHEILESQLRFLCVEFTKNGLKWLPKLFGFERQALS